MAKRGRPKKRRAAKRKKKGLSHLTPGQRKAVRAMWAARGFRTGGKALFIGPKRKRGRKKKMSVMETVRDTLVSPFYPPPSSGSAKTQRDFRFWKKRAGY